MLLLQSRSGGSRRFPTELQTQYKILTTEVFQENSPNGTSGDACGFTFSLRELICKWPTLKECLICAKSREKEQCYCHPWRTEKGHLKFPEIIGNLASEAKKSEEHKIRPNQNNFDFCRCYLMEDLHTVKGLDPTENEKAAISIPSLGPNPAQAKLRWI